MSKEHAPNRRAEPLPVSIVVMAKPAIPGAVNTRLTPAISAISAAQLHATSTRELLDRQYSPQSLGVSAIHRFFAYADDLSPASERSPDGEQPELVRYASERGWHRLAQRGLRLGSRMANALRDSWSFTGDSVILLRGTDAPGLPEASVSALVDAAMSGSFAVVAADDGGYVAAALALSATSIPALDLLFADDLPWGTDGVLGATKAAATRTGLALEVVGRWRDIDLPEDIAEFVEPSTAAWRRRVVEHAPKTAKLLVELARQLPEMKPR